MCFDKFWQVNDVEDPYYQQDVKIFKGRGLTNADYGQFVRSSTIALLHNILFLWIVCLHGRLSFYFV